MKKAWNKILWNLIPVAGLIASTGCQSTGNTAQTIPPAAPVSVESTDTSAAIRPDPTPRELQTVYFEYDRWQLRDDAQRALRNDAQTLQASSGSEVVTVTGHCDERGSEEYNLALGERRAEAVKQYLVDLGISASRIRTLSYGEARPAVPGTGEAAWSRNRRAELSFGTQQASL
jgi:peptidoglycan-associated lipoprotein